MLHPHTEIRYINDAMGLGVFATKPIPKGTLLWVLCPLDRLFSDAEIAALPAAQQRLMAHFAFRDIYDRNVLCWDGGRYINHSCDPVMLPLDYGVEIAVRDIVPGEELTCDYSELNLEQQLACACGSALCRGGISKMDTDVLWPKMDAQVRAALQLANAVAQPLLEYAKYPNFIRRLLDDPARLGSHADFYTAHTPLYELC
jgi:hypothetical protein